MIRSRAAIILRLDRRRPEQPALLDEPSQQPVGDPNDVFAAKNADDIVDFRKLLQERVLLALGQATRDHDSLDVAQPLPFDHLLDDADRFLPGCFDEPAGVDDHEVSGLAIRARSRTVPAPAIPASARNRRGFWNTQD